MIRVECKIKVEIPKLPIDTTVEEYLNDCRFCVYNDEHDDICVSVDEYEIIDSNEQSKAENCVRFIENNRTSIINYMLVHMITDVPVVARVSLHNEVTNLFNIVFDDKIPFTPLSVIDFSTPEHKEYECWAWDEEDAADKYEYLLQCARNKARGDKNE
jgi:hypothetical protein